MLDLEAISENIDVQMLLFTKLRIRYYGVSGKNYIIQCPDPFHLDKHPSCYFHKDTLVYHCFGCSSKGTIVDLIAQQLDIDYFEAEEYLKQKAGISYKSVADSIKARYVQYNMQEVRLSTLFRRDWENARREIRAFVEKKNYNLDIFDKYYVGYNNRIGSITFPIVYHNRIINVGERYVLGNQTTKIKYRKGIPLAMSVWGIFNGYDRHNPFFTEGIADALRMREAGFNAYALLSIVLPNNKMRFLFDHFDGVFTIVPDPDMGGDKMIENWKKCEHHVRVMVMQPRDDDIDATPIQEIKRLATQTKSIRNFMVDEIETEDEICDGVNKRECVLNRSE